MKVKYEVLGHPQQPGHDHILVTRIRILDVHLVIEGLNQLLPGLSHSEFLQQLKVIPRELLLEVRSL